MWLAGRKKGKFEGPIGNGISCLKIPWDRKRSEYFGVGGRGGSREAGCPTVEMKRVSLVRKETLVKLQHSMDDVFHLVLIREISC